MRSDPRQISIFDVLGDATPAPPPATPPTREVLSLDLGDIHLGRVVGYEYGIVDFWQRVADDVGDGLGPTECYVLVRFHDDPKAEVHRRRVRTVDIERDLEWAIEVALQEAGQSLFWHLTGNARPRHLSKR